MNTQYIFFSHSQEDITKARRVRDYLESNSFEPILFNLKCLKDSDELTDPARREIETRKWFLYLDKNPGGYCHIPSAMLNLMTGADRAEEYLEK